MQERQPSIQWMRHYELAKKYYEHYGHLNIPQNFKTKNGVDYDADGFKLGYWICDQRARKRKNKLSQIQIELLENIKIAWECIDLSWNDYYKLAKKYYEHYKNLLIPKNFKTKNGIDYDEDGMPLGIWIGTQRYKYSISELSPKHIKLLEEIEMIWDVYKYTWYQYYNLAKKYYEHYGHSNIPEDFKTIDGINYDENGLAVGKWIKKQRERYKGKQCLKSLSFEQIKLLEEIKIKWFSDNINVNFQKEIIDEENYESKHIELLSRSYSALCNYDLDTLPSKEEINEEFLNRLMIEKNKKTKRPYVRRQAREVVKKVKVENQEEINIEKTKEWFRKYKIAKAYYEEHGNLLMPLKFVTKDGEKIGRWIEYNRKRYLKNKLSSIKIYLLEKIGMVWVANEYKWDNYYDLLEVYYDTYGDINVPRDFKTSDGINYDENGLNIFNWLDRQRVKYKEETLTSDQIEKLENLGIVWDKDLEIWDSFYQLAKNYYKYYGNLLIPQDFKTKNGIDYDNDGLSLGKWISKQRQAYKANSSNRINCYQIYLLEKIGMVWFDRKVDDRLQKQIITNLNIINKKREILNRTYSLLNSYDLKSLPSKEQINDDFVKKLTLTNDE